MSSLNNTVVGTFTGTGAAVNISLGFIPNHVEVVNITDGDDKWEWFTGMAAASAIYIRDVVDSGSTGNHAMSKITSNGISTYPGDATTAKGFTAGSALSESGKTFAYKAVQNGG